MDEGEIFRRLMLDESGRRFTDALVEELILAGGGMAVTVNPQAHRRALSAAAVHFACASAHSENASSGSAERSTHHARLAYWALGKPFPGDTKALSIWRRFLAFFKRA